jgi:cell wall-associated NlpC family hydrolase
LTSGSAEEFVSQPAALEAIAGHADEVLGEGAASAAVAQRARAEADAGQAAVDTALAQVGDAYVWGASGPDAFDCSGLTQYAYAAAGINLPHSTRMQATMGTAVSRADLQPGDLIFYYSPVSHVSMYNGNGHMVPASTAGGCRDHRLGGRHHRHPPRRLAKGTVGLPADTAATSRPDRR